MKRFLWLGALTVLGLWPGVSRAAEIDGASLSFLWAIPFAGILLSIAILPLLAPSFWHHHFGKVSAAWTLAFFVPFAVQFGPGLAAGSLAHAMLAEYIPFIVLLTALYTIAGGIFIRGNQHGSPTLNTALLAKRLQSRNGFLPLTDKSSAEEIYEELGISKKAFKKALGALYKERKVRIEEDGITWVG